MCTQLAMLCFPQGSPGEATHKGHCALEVTYCDTEQGHRIPGESCCGGRALICFLYRAWSFCPAVLAGGEGGASGDMKLPGVRGHGTTHRKTELSCPAP